MAKITETELQRRLRELKAQNKAPGPTATKVGSTWEYTQPVLYLAYADSLTNLAANGTIPNQSDATGFGINPFNSTGQLKQWRGYLFSKSLYASGDPTDYVWEDINQYSSSVTFVRYYTTTPGLVSDVGDPDNAVSGVTWTQIATGSAVPADAFFVAEKYTMNGVTSAWYVFPTKVKEVGTPLATYTITGRNKPALTSTQWADDAIVCIEAHTGDDYSSVKEFGYGTAIVIEYDDGKQYAIYKKNTSGQGEWVVPTDFIDGDFLVNGTINTDKVAANAITGGKIDSATTITAGSGNNVGVLDGADAYWRIYAGNSTPANAPFRVGQDGKVVIESASSGSRLVLDDDTIKVYNNGTLRVKIGNLS